MKQLKVFFIIISCIVAMTGISSHSFAESKDKKKPDDKGDTYNFYFQKAPGAQKVKQGESQEVEQIEQQSDEKNYSRFEKKESKREYNADLMIGLIGFPAKSAWGIALAGHAYTKSTFGFRLGLFSASTTRGSDDSSSFSAFGINESVSSNTLLGGDLAVSLDFVKSQKMRISALLGGQVVNDKNTTETYSFTARGSSDSSKSSSSLKVNPYAGLSGTFYFSDRFGMNASFAVPFAPKYSTVSINFAVNI